MAERAQLNSLSDEYQSLQTGKHGLPDLVMAQANLSVELSTLVSARQKLESQQQENVGVQKEFNGLADDATIYKLVGPVLLKQDTTEAKSTVDGRLSYIEQEMWVLTIPSLEAMAPRCFADFCVVRESKEASKASRRRAKERRWRSVVALLYLLCCWQLLIVMQILQIQSQMQQAQS